MSTAALAIPELPEPSIGKNWTANPRSLWRHLWRRVDPCGFYLIGLITDIVTAAPGDEILRQGIKRAADPEGNPTTGDQLYRSRAYIPVEVFQHGGGYASPRQIQRCLKQAIDAGLLGCERDPHGYPCYWPKPENFRLHDPRPPRRHRRKPREASLLEPMPAAALHTPVGEAVILKTPEMHSIAPLQRAG